MMSFLRMCVKFFLFIVTLLSPHSTQPMFVHGTQSFIQQPADTAVNMGTDSVILHCLVADKAGELFWTVNNHVLGWDYQASIPGRPRFSIVGDTSRGEYNLRITNVALDDDGEYKCQVTLANNEPQLISTPARLTVQRAPSSVALVQGTTLSVVVSVPANLTCTAKGANPAASITWFRDNVALDGALYKSKPAINDPSGRLWDAVSVLTVTPALLDHGILYECRASNAAISEPVTAGLTLDVQHAPVVAMETIPAEIREETTALCRCVVDANPRSVSYVWSKNGETLTGEVNNDMELLVTKEDHGATISCSVTNTIGTGEGSLELNVLYGPRLVEPPVSVSVDEGEPAQMQCIGDGNPTPTTKWTRFGSRATLSTMQRLQFDSVRESDTGVYICTITVPGFESITTIGRLDLNSIPVITSAPMQLAKKGGTGVLECQTDSKPDPDSVVWSWQDMELETGSSEGRYRAELSDTDLGGVTSYLRIEKVRKEDFGEYNCTMSNSMGSQSVVIVLEQQGLDLIIYIIIGVVAASFFVFVMTIITLAYCRRRCRKKKVQTENVSKEAIPVEIIPQVMSLKDALAKGKKSPRGGADDPDGSPHSSSSRHRYAMPHEFVRRNSWDDPHYRRGQANEYSEPHHFDRRPSPPWNAGYSDHEEPYHDADDNDPYRKRERYSNYDMDDPEPIYRGRSIHSQASRASRRSDHGDYVDAGKFRNIDPYDRYEARRSDDYDDRYGYDRDSEKLSEVSYDSKERLATNV
ncbi:kin of IRRE-like protein 3 [Diadema setosum]|uniref:kin of IRRE-like protein 3 n=1 Tax=Diadema setosum TaxID=31175 RepID=UPI003B3B7A35